MMKTLIIILVTLLVSSSPILSSQEITLFDADGEATAIDMGI